MESDCVCLHNSVYFTDDERRNRSGTSIAADSLPESVENPYLALRLYVSVLLRHEVDEKQKLNSGIHKQHD